MKQRYKKRWNKGKRRGEPDGQRERERQREGERERERERDDDDDEGKYLLRFALRDLKPLSTSLQSNNSLSLIAYSSQIHGT